MVVVSPTPLSGVEPSSGGVRSDYMKWGPLLLRAVISVLIVGIFMWINYKVIGIVEKFAEADTSFIKEKIIQPNDRLINETVMMSLIAGTVTQVVTVLIGITRFLFPAPKE